MSADKKQESVDMSVLNSALAEDRADRVRALKRKIQCLANEYSEVLESLTPAGRKRVDALREIQSQRDELKAKFFEERAALEAKYQKLYDTLYNKRYEIVNGIIEGEGVTAEVKDETPAEDKASEEKGVPNFWLNAMKANEILNDEIQERDEGALKFLKDIKWCRLDDPEGFKLEFFFGPNPYFKNSVLTKTYHMITKISHMIDDEKPIHGKTIGTEIEWLPGKCLTQKILKQKPEKRLKNAKPITWDCESFFNFFNPPRFPDDIDEDDFHVIENQMEEDYEIGSIISDKIIPHAVLWFTREAVDYTADGSEEDNDDKEDEDEYEDDKEDEDDEEDEDEDEDDEEDFAVEGQQGEGPAECKQQ